MTREEEIKQGSIDYMGPVNEFNPLPWIAFREGAKWADSCPRKGLVDIDRASEWIALHITEYLDRSDWMAEDFKKAMEE